MTTPITSDHRESAAPVRFQFRIRDLLLIMLLVALAVGAAVQQSPLLLLTFLGTGAFCLYSWRMLWSGVTLAQFVVATGGTILAIALLLPFLQSARGPDRRMSCANNLKQIVLALQNYHDVYGTLPPAYIADENGKPMHSWRVLILPFMEHKSLYDQYRFDEPWDGPHNSQLADRIRHAYSCPSVGNSIETNYVAIVGAHTPWPGQKARSFGVFKDGAANVILVVEVHSSGIHWMEPRDLDVSQMVPTINIWHGLGISSAHRDGANVGFADGAVRWLPDSTAAETLRSWININDGTLIQPPQ